MNTVSQSFSNAVLYRRLLARAWPYKWIFGAALCGMLIGAAGDTAFAWMLQPIIDEGFVERDQSYIQWIPLALIGIALARAFGQFVDGYCINWVARKIIQDLRQQMFERLIYAPTAFFNRNSSGVLVARLTYDVEQVARATSSAFRVLCYDSIKVLFLMSLMVYLSWQLSLIFLLILPPSFWVFRYTGDHFRRISSRIQESVGEITHVARQAFAGHRLVKIFSAYDHEKHRFFAANKRNRQQAMKKAAILSASAPLLVFIMGVGVAGVIWLALLLQIKPGAFASYLFAMGMIVRPIKHLSEVNEAIQTGLAGAESIFRTIDQPIEPDGGTVVLQAVKDKVSFNDVSFNYADADTVVLQGVNFEIPAGTITALVGPSGSGKSTIASLLMRLFTPTSGSVSIDDQPLTELTLKSLRDQIAVVSQEVVLADDTVVNNVVYGWEGEVDQQRLQLAVEASGLNAMAAQLPHGLDTVVGEAGMRLSGGQRQRIAIARALYKDAPLLIMDEATSALDSRSEQFILHAMERLIRDRTTLVIAHRLSTVENADQILVLEQGRVVERGNHAELMAKQGSYFGLYHSGFSPEPEQPEHVA